MPNPQHRAFLLAVEEELGQDMCEGKMLEKSEVHGVLHSAHRQGYTTENKNDNV